MGRRPVEPASRRWLPDPRRLGLLSAVV